MAAREPDDSSKLAVRAMHRPGTPEGEAHYFIAHVLRRHYGEAAELPAADAWRHAAMFLTDYARHPWGDDKGAAHTDGLRKYRRERRILEHAANILATDLARLPKASAPDAENVTVPWPIALRIALGVLKSARNSHHPEIAAVSQHGPPMRGWSHVARELAHWLAPPLRALDVSVSTRKTSPFVKTMRDLLAAIYGDKKAPSHSGISKALADFDGKR